MKYTLKYFLSARARVEMFLCTYVRVSMHPCDNKHLFWTDRQRTLHSPLSYCTCVVWTVLCVCFSCPHRRNFNSHSTDSKMHSAIQRETDKERGTTMRGKSGIALACMSPLLRHMRPAGPNSTAWTRARNRDGFIVSGSLMILLRHYANVKNH